jgi:hypothetical protein
VLSIQICLLPAEVATPDYVVIYIQEVTEQVIVKQAHRNQVEAFQNLQLNYTTLTQNIHNCYRHMISYKIRAPRFFPYMSNYW